MQPGWGSDWQPLICKNGLGIYGGYFGGAVGLGCSDGGAGQCDAGHTQLVGCLDERHGPLGGLVYWKQMAVLVDDRRLSPEPYRPQVLITRGSRYTMFAIRACRSDRFGLEALHPVTLGFVSYLGTSAYGVGRCFLFGMDRKGAAANGRCFEDLPVLPRQPSSRIAHRATADILELLQVNSWPSLRPPEALLLVQG